MAETTKNQSTSWSCSSCHTTDEKLRYASGLMKQCYTCQYYSNMQINCKQKKHKLSLIVRKVTFTLNEFLEWTKTHPRICRYCGITDSEYYALGYRSANNKTLEALGIDRRNDGDYDLSDIDWCCYPCNRTKANSLTCEEMATLSPGLKSIWQKRLADGETGINSYATLIPSESVSAKPKRVTVLKPKPVKLVKFTKSKLKKPQSKIKK